MLQNDYLTDFHSLRASKFGGFEKMLYLCNVKTDMEISN